MNTLTKKTAQKVQVTRINTVYSVNTGMSSPRTRVIKDYVYSPAAKIII